jgi:ArsR family transcriptional regulator
MTDLTLDVSAMQAKAKAAASFLKALAHPDRLLLLCQLSHGEVSVSELEAELGLHQPSLSQQLTVLRHEGLVSARREGQRMLYRLTSPQALAVLRELQVQFCVRPTAPR